MGCPLLHRVSSRRCLHANIFYPSLDPEAYNFIMPAKLYCYVDETGQHTQGELFIVCVVLASSERDDLLSVCEVIESRTGKRSKWIKTAYELRAAYIREVLNQPLFYSRLTFSVFKQTTDYTGATILAISRAIQASGETDYKATILIDGLTRSQEQTMARSLRQRGIRLRKLRGARDESNALIRLTDSICGLVAAALGGQPIMKRLYDRALESGFLRDISGGE